MTKKNDKKDYQKHVATVSGTQARRSLAGRDIIDGWDDLKPSQAELDIRNLCKYDLRLFLSTYFPDTFWRPFCDDQLEYIHLAQKVILSGDCHSIALPRGEGKSSILFRAVIWSLLYNHRSYPFLVAATADLAKDNHKTIRQELSTNQLLLKPFRAICYPLSCLFGSAKKAGGQLFKGENTFIEWSADRLVFPTMPDDAFDGLENTSGHIVESSGITGAMRGKQQLLPSGKTIRPDFAALDDVCDREAAQSPTQVANLLKIIRGDILGLAGVGQPIAAIAAVTVIAENDVADQLTDRKRNPEWQGLRKSFIKAWPKNLNLWEEYINRRREYQREGKDVQLATDFYIANQTAMDEGAIVADPHAKEDRDISALQWAMNKRALVGDQEFASEYQNEPLKPDASGLVLQTAAEIASKINHLPQSQLPDEAHHISAFVDIADSVLHWTIVAWSNTFDGWIIDYGLYPEQEVVLSKRAKKTIPKVGGIEASIRAAIDTIVTSLKNRTFVSESGNELQIGKILIDSGYHTDVVKNYCRGKGPIIMPSKGRPFRAKDRPIEELTLKPTEQRGHRWLIPPPVAGSNVKVVNPDVNYWKSFVHARLQTPIGDKGCLSIYGNDPSSHLVLAQNLIGEFPIRVTAQGRTVDEWDPYPDHRDNHFLDCLVGCAVGASMLGCKLPSADEAIAKERKTYKYSELLKSKQPQQKRGSVY